MSKRRKRGRRKVYFCRKFSDGRGLSHVWMSHNLQDQRRVWGLSVMVDLSPNTLLGQLLILWDWDGGLDKVIDKVRWDAERWDREVADCDISKRLFVSSKIHHRTRTRNVSRSFPSVNVLYQAGKTRHRTRTRNISRSWLLPLGEAMRETKSHVRTTSFYDTTSCTPRGLDCLAQTRSFIITYHHAPFSPFVGAQAMQQVTNCASKISSDSRLASDSSFPSSTVSLSFNSWYNRPFSRFFHHNLHLSILVQSISSSVPSTPRFSDIHLTVPNCVLTYIRTA